MTLRTLNYGNYGIFLIMGHAGFCPSTESLNPKPFGSRKAEESANPGHQVGTEGYDRSVCRASGVRFGFRA